MAVTGYGKGMAGYGDAGGRYFASRGISIRERRPAALGLRGAPDGGGWAATGGSEGEPEG